MTTATEAKCHCGKQLKHTGRHSGSSKAPAPVPPPSTQVKAKGATGVDAMLARALARIQKRIEKAEEALAKPLAITKPGFYALRAAVVQ